MHGAGWWMFPPSGYLIRTSLECAMDAQHSSNSVSAELITAHTANGSGGARLQRAALHALFTGVAIQLSLAFFSVPSHGSSQVTIEYEYDDLNRLTRVVRESQAASVRYRYDEVSNLEWIAGADSPDSDGDDIPNFADSDDDNDGIPDSVEIAAGLDALDAVGHMGALGDFDNDGIANIDEYLQGSDINHFHGDLDSDSDLDLGDLIVLKRIILGLQDATQEQGESGHGDVNMDGNLDVGDLVILKHLYFE